MVYIPKIFKNSAIYSIVTLLQKGIAFFLLPLYTAFLTPEDFGTINVVLSISGLLSVLILMSLQGAGTRFHYDTTEESKRRVLWGTITTIVILSSIGWTTVFFILHRYIIDPFVGEVDFYPYLVLGLINTGISPLYILFQSYLQASQKAVHYGVNMLSNFIVHIALAILLIAYFKLGALGMLLANVITSLLFFIYVLLIFVPKLTLGLKKNIAKASINYSLPLLPHQLSIWGSGTIDRLLLNGISGRNDTGLYSVGNQIGQVVGTVAYSVNQAFVPWFFENLKKGEEGIKQIVRFGDFAVFGYAILALFISLYAPEILSVMVSEEYYVIWKLMPFISFAFVFHGAYFIFINVLFIRDTNLVFIVTLVSLVINILANIVLIPIWGVMGGAVACFLTYLVRSLMAMCFSIVKNKDIRYNYFRIYAFIFVLFGISFMNYLQPFMSFPSGLLIKSLLILILALVLYYTNKKHITIFFNLIFRHS